MTLTVRMLEIIRDWLAAQGFHRAAAARQADIEARRRLSTTRTRGPQPGSEA